MSSGILTHVEIEHSQAEDRKVRDTQDPHLQGFQGLFVHRFDSERKYMKGLGFSSQSLFSEAAFWKLSSSFLNMSRQKLGKHSPWLLEGAWARPLDLPLPASLLHSPVLGSFEC